MPRTARRRARAGFVLTDPGGTRTSRHPGPRSPAFFRRLVAPRQRDRATWQSQAPGQQPHQRLHWRRRPPEARAVRRARRPSPSRVSTSLLARGTTRTGTSSAPCVSRSGGRTSAVMVRASVHHRRRRACSPRPTSPAAAPARSARRRSGRPTSRRRSQWAFAGRPG